MRTVPLSERTVEIIMPSRLQGADTCGFCLPPSPYHIVLLAQSRSLPWKYNCGGITQAQCQVDVSVSQICSALKVIVVKILF